MILVRNILFFTAFLLTPFILFSESYDWEEYVDEVESSVIQITLHKKVEYSEIFSINLSELHPALSKGKIEVQRFSSLKRVPVNYRLDNSTLTFLMPTETELREDYEPTPYRYKRFPNEEFPFFYVGGDYEPIDYTFRAYTWTKLIDGFWEKVIDLTAYSYSGYKMFHPFRILGKVTHNDDIKYFEIDALFATSKVPHIGIFTELSVPNDYYYIHPSEGRISVYDYTLHYNDSFLAVLTRGAPPIFKSKNKKELRGIVYSVDGSYYYNKDNKSSFDDLSKDNKTGNIYIAPELLDKILNERRGPVYFGLNNSKTWNDWNQIEMFIGRCTAEGRLFEAEEGAFALLICERERVKGYSNTTSARTQRSTVDKEGRFFFNDVPDNMSCSVKGWSKESGRFYEVYPGSFKYTCEPLKKKPEDEDNECEE
jgi:hypothetical protein